MTCIVGLIASSGDLIFGADSQVTVNDSTKIILPDKKIFIKNNILFGFCGNLNLGQLVKHKFIPPTPGRTKDIEQFIHTKLLPELKRFFKEEGFIKFSTEEDYEDEIELLIGFNRSMFVIDNNYAVMPVSTRFHALGGGSDFALGSFHSTRENSNDMQRVTMALDAACTFSTGCCKPFHIEKLPGEAKIQKSKPKDSKKRRPRR